MEFKIVKLGDEEADAIMEDNPMNWFYSIYGFSESFEQCKQNLSIIVENDIPKLTSLCSGKKYRCGVFSTPTIHELRTKAIELLNNSNVKLPTTYSHMIIDDVFEMHYKYPKSTFQVASQLNCLEFPSPASIPEDGITYYAEDNTQGPACSIACASGTIYRNYFAVLPGTIGQTQHSQFNLLDELEQRVDNSNHKYWTVRNGYMNSTDEDITRLNRDVLSYDLDELAKNIKVGVHEDVGVAFCSKYNPIEEDVYVTQVFCSAVSCRYTSISTETWQPIAELILQSQYEGAIWAAVLNHLRGGSNKLFLTFVGGGVFGNKEEWIGRSISRAIRIAMNYHTGLDIRICHYKCMNEEIKEHVDRPSK